MEKHSRIFLIFVQLQFPTGSLYLFCSLLLDQLVSDWLPPSLTLISRYLPRMLPTCDSRISPKSIQINSPHGRLHGTNKESEIEMNHGRRHLPYNRAALLSTSAAALAVAQNDAAAASDAAIKAGAHRAWPRRVR